MFKANYISKAYWNGKEVGLVRVEDYIAVVVWSDENGNHRSWVRAEDVDITGYAYLV